MVLLDLRCIGTTGKVADLLVSDVHITANKNTVPFDPNLPSSQRTGWNSRSHHQRFDIEAFREVADGR